MVYIAPIPRLQPPQKAQAGSTGPSHKKDTDKAELKARQRHADNAPAAKNNRNDSKKQNTTKLRNNAPFKQAVLGEIGRQAELATLVLQREQATFRALHSLQGDKTPAHHVAAQYTQPAEAKWEPELQKAHAAVTTAVGWTAKNHRCFGVAPKAVDPSQVPGLGGTVRPPAAEHGPSTTKQQQQQSVHGKQTAAQFQPAVLQQKQKQQSQEQQQPQSRNSQQRQQKQVKAAPEIHNAAIVSAAGGINWNGSDYANYDAAQAASASGDAAQHQHWHGSMQTGPDDPQFRKEQEFGTQSDGQHWHAAGRDSNQLTHALAQWTNGFQPRQGMSAMPQQQHHIQQHQWQQPAAAAAANPADELANALRGAHAHPDPAIRDQLVKEIKQQQYKLELEQQIADRKAAKQAAKVAAAAREAAEEASRAAAPPPWDPLANRRGGGGEPVRAVNGAPVADLRAVKGRQQEFGAGTSHPFAGEQQRWQQQPQQQQLLHQLDMQQRQHVAEQHNYLAGMQHPSMINHPAAGFLPGLSSYGSCDGGALAAQSSAGRFAGEADGPATHRGNKFMGSIAELKAGPSMEQRAAAAAARQQLQVDLQAQVADKQARAAAAAAADASRIAKEQAALSGYYNQQPGGPNNQQMQRQAQQHQQQQPPLPQQQSSLIVNVAVAHEGPSAFVPGSGMLGSAAQHPAHAAGYVAATADNAAPLPRKGRSKHVIEVPWLDKLQQEQQQQLPHGDQQQQQQAVLQQQMQPDVQLQRSQLDLGIAPSPLGQHSSTTTQPMANQASYGNALSAVPNGMNSQQLAAALQDLQQEQQLMWQEFTKQAHALEQLLEEKQTATEETNAAWAELERVRGLLAQQQQQHHEDQEMQQQHKQQLQTKQQQQQQQRVHQRSPAKQRPMQGVRQNRQQQQQPPSEWHVTHASLQQQLRQCQQQQRREPLHEQQNSLHAGHSNFRMCINHGSNTSRVPAQQHSHVQINPSHHLTAADDSDCLDALMVETQLVPVSVSSIPDDAVGLEDSLMHLMRAPQPAIWAAASSHLRDSWALPTARGGSDELHQQQQDAKWQQQTSRHTAPDSVAKAEYSAGSVGSYSQQSHTVTKFATAGSSPNSSAVLPQQQEWPSPAAQIDSKGNIHKPPASPPILRSDRFVGKPQAAGSIAAAAGGPAGRRGSQQRTAAAAAAGSGVVKAAKGSSMAPGAGQARRLKWSKT